MTTRAHRPGLTVRHKFLAAFIMAAFLPLAVFAFIAFHSTSRALESQSHVDMKNRTGGMLAVLDRTGDAGVDQVVSFGEWNPFCRAIDRRDTDWIESNVTVWAPRNTALKGAQVLAPDGVVVSAGGQFKGAALKGLPLVQAAMEGKAGYDVQNVNGRLFILSAGPVVEEDKANPPVHGVVVFGQPVDGALLAEVARYIGASQLSLYANDRAIATSDGGSPAAIPAGARLGEPFTNGSRTLILDELRDRQGDVQGVLSLAVESSALSVTSSTLRQTVWFAMLAALAVALSIGLLMSNAVSRPLRRLAQAATAIAGGETHQHIEVNTRDEIGEVAEAFNTMSERVTHQLEGMTEKMRAMSVEIASLNTFGETLAQMPDARAELRRLTEAVAGVFSADFATLYLEEEPFGLVAAAEFGNPDGAEAVADHLAAAASVTGRPAIGGKRGAEHPGAGTLLAVPIAFSGEVAGALALGASTEAFYHEDDLALLATIAGQIAIALHNAEAYAKLDAINLQTVTALAAAMEAKDHYTAEHADTLAAMATAVGRRLGLSESEQRQLRYAAVLHDIGKIGVPGTILNKRGKLTDNEFAAMAEHTLIGERIISRIEYLRPIARLVRSAHERWDGAGYPDGLAGAQIPLGSRVLLACDAYHAMTSDRPYRGAMSTEEALEELRRNSGSQFDPDVIAAFFAEYVPEIWDSARAD
jgi:HD-GYP domain-containing protein (c-di-GMP phosphodiesterase class II)/sensor domain CHASE-containing protein